MSSSDRQFQYVPRYKHFVKASFIKRHSLLCFIAPHLISPTHGAMLGIMVQWVLDAITSRLCIVLMAMRFSFVAVWYTANLRLTSTYYSKTTEPYASYARITHLLLYAYRQG